ncbi:hypothetical protein L218DRAFT_958454 [Marasmius fiardii PR-910]|nr:hypothetical protein L218DRAFT_958454 [Marasmius fiardii PR-910]
MSELGDIDEQLQEEDDDDGVRQLTHRRSRSLPVDVDWGDPIEPDPAYDKSANITHPRTSTPIRDPHPASTTSPPRALSLLPTRSNGSTISSIRGRLSGTPRPSTSTQPSSIHPPPRDPHSVAEILTSCKPSLMHLEPILYDLGIRTEDHLKAVGKMSEGTRDREIKKVAVEKGVTVLEWAMLIDKMQDL